MIYNVTLDNTDTMILHDKSRRGIKTENLAVKGIPEGFMTGDEFERQVKEELKHLYIEHGLL
jgi:hypothetical protein